MALDCKSMEIFLIGSNPIHPKIFKIKGGVAQIGRVVES